MTVPAPAISVFAAPFERSLELDELDVLLRAALVPELAPLRALLDLVRELLAFVRELVAFVRELLDLARELLDLVRELLDFPLVGREADLPFALRDDPLDDFFWVLEGEPLDERALAAAITLTSVFRRPPPLPNAYPGLCRENENCRARAPR